MIQTSKPQGTDIISEHGNIGIADEDLFDRKTTRVVGQGGQTTRVEALQGPHECGLRCLINNECGFPFMAQLNH